jgi:hypothetical protein
MYAIREGKPQWGYRFAAPAVSRFLFGIDGRLWGEVGQSEGGFRFMVYNSRGEGGLISVKNFPDLSYSSKITPRGWQQGGIGGYVGSKQFEYKSCELGELIGIYRNPNPPYSDQRWMLNVQGTCGPAGITDEGDLVTVTDAGIMYCVTRQGRVRWTHKPACTPEHLIPLRSIGVVYQCADMLHAVMEGKSGWNLRLERQIDYSAVNVDAATTLYLLSEPPNSFLAIDKTGKLLWQLPFSSAIPLGLDDSGRVYIRSGTTLLCLSD